MCESAEDIPPLDSRDNPYTFLWMYRVWLLDSVNATIEYGFALSRWLSNLYLL
jgi:hypothetical protein